MRTLLIDNHDSFTFNLAQLVGQVTGHWPRVLRNDACAWEEVESWLPDFDAILLSPGPGRPERPKDFGLCAQALRQTALPVLGVCLGCQGIALHAGGDIRHAPRPMHGRLSRIRHDGEGLFRGLPQDFEAVRYHSLQVATPLPKTLRQTATAEDGVVMGIAHQTLRQWGVQFHPESICTEHGARILENFQTLVGAHRRPRPPPRSETPKVTPPSPWRVLWRRTRGPDAEQTFHHLYKASRHAFWLDSSLVTPGGARFSFMGDDSGPHALKLSYRVDEHTLRLEDPKGVTQQQASSPFETLAHLLKQRAATATDLPFDFLGGWVGYFGYELKEDCGGARAHRAPLPDCQLLFADRFLAFDHQTADLYLVALVPEGDEPQAHRDLEALEARLQAAPPLPPSHLEDRHPAGFRLRRPKHTYLEDVKRCLDALADGESYEVCLTNRLVADVDVDPWRLHRALRALNPAPHAAFLRLPDASIICSSPERLLKVGADGWAESRPIKGTLGRGSTPEEDAALAAQLRASEKDRAENLMIVDLVRNDFGRVCELGSVHVPELMAVERYATVHQLVSTIRGRLPADRTAVDLLRSVFPPGSMVGAPKLRTLALLDALEPDARGVYSGSLGYLSVNGAADLNVVIRTAVVTRGQVTVGVGGAVVALSDPEAEVEELLLKGRALVEAVERVSPAAASEAPGSAPASTAPASAPPRRTA